MLEPSLISASSTLQAPRTPSSSSHVAAPRRFPASPPAPSSLRAQAPVLPAVPPYLPPRTPRHPTPDPARPLTRPRPPPPTAYPGPS